jgi:hypothetical protein
MFKKSHFFISLFLGVFIILAFTACPTSTGSNQTTTGEVPETTPTWPKTTTKKDLPVSGSTTTSDINNQLNNSSNTTVNLESNGGSPVTVTTNAALEIPTGKVLEISEDVTLTIPSGQTAEITGTVNVKEDAVLDLSAADEEEVVVKGLVTIQAGGTFKVNTASTANKSPIDYDGGTLRLLYDSNAWLNVGTDVHYIGPDGGAAIFQWPASAAGTYIDFTSEAGVNTITVKGGELFVADSATVQVGVIDSDAKVTIKSSATSLNVYISLVVNGALVANNTIKGVAGATLTFDSGATLTGDYLGDDDNFYAYGSTSKEAPTAGKSYTWNADAGGSTVAGWKADS